MVVEFIDVMLPIAYFIVVAVLTVPIVSALRNYPKLRKVIEILWFLIVYGVAAVLIANLALKYYAVSSSTPYLMIPITLDKNQAIYSSAVLVDALSIFMAIIFVIISAIVFLYTLWATDVDERPV